MTGKHIRPDYHKTEYAFNEEPYSEFEVPKGFYQSMSEREFREKYITDEKAFKAKYGFESEREKDKRKEQQQGKKKSDLEAMFSKVAIPWNKK